MSHHIVPLFIPVDLALAIERALPADANTWALHDPAGEWVEDFTSLEDALEHVAAAGLQPVEVDLPTSNTTGTTTSTASDGTPTTHNTQEISQP